MRLIFVRHGEPDYDNDCLTETGRSQAQKTADRLTDEPMTAIYASPMGRAVETAFFTAKQHGLEIQKLDFMHEIDWGTVPDAEPLPCEGHPWTLGFRLLTEEPELIGSQAWREHRYFRDNLCLEYYDRVAEAFDGFLAGFGICRKDGLYESRMENDDTIALFAHGGSGAVMFSHVLSLPFPFVLTTLPYGVCSISVIDFSPQLDGRIIPRLSLFNDMTHLGQVKEERLRFEK